VVRGKKAVCLIAAVVGCLQIMGCLRDSEEHVMQRGQDSVSFELKSGPSKSISGSGEDESGDTVVSWLGPTFRHSSLKFVRQCG